MQTYKLSEIADFISGRLVGADLEIVGINAIPCAGENELIFVDSLLRLRQALGSQAKACVTIAELSAELIAFGKSVIEVSEPRVALAKVSALFTQRGIELFGTSERAFVHPTASIAERVLIMPFAYIGARARIEQGAVIYPFCYVGDDCIVGEGSVLYPRVTLYPGTVVGKRCIIHSGVVLGADGFGFAQEPAQEGFVNLKIHHFGGVRIEDDVEIGANSCVDRATFGETVIGENTKIDNLVQVGHNVKVGRSCVIVAQVGLGGSVEVGDYAMIGGQSGLAPGSKIGKLAKIAARSGVAGKIEDGEEVAGTPAIKASTWRRAVVIFAKLPELYQKLKKV